MEVSGEYVVKVGVAVVVAVGTLFVAISGELKDAFAVNDSVLEKEVLVDRPLTVFLIVAGV